MRGERLDRSITTAGKGQELSCSLSELAWFEGCTHDGAQAAAALLTQVPPRGLVLSRQHYGVGQ